MKTSLNSTVLVVAGTRPECLKLASLVTALRQQPSLRTVLVNSGQHEQMVERTFAHVGIACDVQAGQIAPASLSHALASLRAQIRRVAAEQRADLVVSQGDTTTAYAASLAARDLLLPLAHVEAGLRTSHPYRPFPEELFRRRIAPIAALHFAPTVSAAQNLRHEGIAEARIHRVGNTVIDLLRWQVESPDPVPVPQIPGVRDLITLTLHRRENYGRGLDVVCASVLDLLARHPEAGVVCPVHPNPAVGGRIRRHLSTHPRVALVDPMDYQPFIALLAHSRLAITDSGGIQEEAPYLGTPVLVVRENTERPESVAIGAATLVPPRVDRIVAEADRILAAPPPARLPFSADAPYGDGYSGERIAAEIARFLAIRSAQTARPAAVPA
ncbi:non-hydrolyzing UDP-N-acetylglucosamine 2-epimerase [Tahibacter amnicola]|uniref:UDP-N-acetylglucosamine 2-epimerase (non-hydrolyzing) n=1 Tax=Tahibacter amnicola TaxID=2976241 RepID=A0ABY6BMT7_9GAMM|nr:UDP-N-acetylglucosamine 2-epimerase (non-hydrolyzing) [Tahibacter amnicola]UXI69700.1 UDP-N-acetylglucosamine 2-epimerase (non-hydrolyzing) [Tahibacter amnicola]